MMDQEIEETCSDDNNRNNGEIVPDKCCIISYEIPETDEDDVPYT